MFRIIKLIVSLCSLIGFAWFGMTVDLGERTLFQHVSAIAGSKESEELVRGTKETVTSLFEGEESKADRGKEKPPVVVKERPPERAARGDGKSLATTAPQDGLTAGDRQGMRKLINNRRPTDPPTLQSKIDSRNGDRPTPKRADPSAEKADKKPDVKSANKA